MKIAIINAHVAYLYMLAKTGHQFFVFNHQGAPCWDPRQRPLPANIILMDSAINVVPLMGLPLNYFDAAILQDTMHQDQNGLDVKDRIIFEKLQCRKIMLFHNSFLTQFRQAPPDKWADIKKQLAERLKDCKKVFISDWKRQSWGMDGVVIRPGIDLEEFGGWRGTKKITLTCLNNANYRDFMNGTQKMKLVAADYKHLMLGEENGKGNFAPDFENYKNTLRECMSYLALNNPDFEDDYNLSMLEFMATGGLAITLDHPRSIIKTGVNGFKSDDLQELNRFLHSLTQEQAHVLGRGARKTVEEQFNINTFIDNWNEVLEMQ
jgi:hypothetical protein